MIAVKWEPVWTVVMGYHGVDIVGKVVDSDHRRVREPGKRGMPALLRMQARRPSKPLHPRP